MSKTCAHRSLERHKCVETGVLPDDLYDYGYPQPSPRIGRPVKHDLAGWTVTDDWPEHIPVTEAEVDVFERDSAICSMNSSGRANDGRRRLLP